MDLGMQGRERDPPQAVKPAKNDCNLFETIAEVGNQLRAF